MHKSSLTLVLGFLILGLFPALTDGVQGAFVSELSIPENREGALGLVNAISGIRFLIAGIGDGYIWEHFGVGYALAIASSFVLVGIIVLITMPKKIS